MRKPPSLSNSLEELIRRKHQILENFKLAVSNNNSKEVKKLLENNKDLKQESIFGAALCDASRRGHVEVVEALIKAKAEIDSKMDTSIKNCV
jgi:predicted CopG family antitoxin